MTVKSKENKTNAIYNPALDKYQDVDLFPAKTKAAREHLKGRDIRREIEEVLRKEKITKP